MRNILRIAARDYNTSVRSKAFILGLIIAPIFMCGSIIAFAIFKDRVDTTDKPIVVIDRSGVEVARHIEEKAKERNEIQVYDPETGEKKKPAYIIRVEPPNQEDPQAQRLALSDQVRNKEIFAFIEIGSAVLHHDTGREDAALKYYSENSALSDEKEWLQYVINPYLQMQRGRQVGIPEDTVKQVAHRTYISGHGLFSLKDSGEVKDAERSNKAQALFVPIIMAMMLFLMMMMGAMPLVGAVLEEKTQRISEVLLGSIRPFGLMMGKVIGGTAVSLTGITVYVIAAYFAARYYEIEEMIPFHLLPWFFFYMIAAIFMFGSLLAAVGAACNDQRELQGIMPFVMIPMMVPMFVLIPVIKEPLGGLATVLSLIPPFTPMTMMLRQATPTTLPGWQPWVGLAGVVIFTLFSVWAGGRIFRIGILMQGKAPKIGDLAKWVFRG